MNQRKSPDQWRTILADYERSNQTQAAFCRRRHLALSTFQYHRQRERDNGGPAQRLIEIRPAASAQTTLLCDASAATTLGNQELRIEIPLSSSCSVTLRCALDQVSEVIAQLALSSHHLAR